MMIHVFETDVKRVASNLPVTRRKGLIPSAARMM